MLLSWPQLMPIGTAILRFVPRRVGLSMAYWLGSAWYYLAADRRRVIASNLERLAPSLGHADRRRLARATFRHFAAICADALRLPFLSRQEIRGLIDADSHARFDRLLAGIMAEGRGALVVTAHLGAVDLAAVAVAAAGWRTTGVAEPIPAADFEIWRRYRAHTGLRLLSQRDAALSVFRALKRGEIVAIVADRHLAGAGTVVNWGAGRRMLPTGPAAFAIRTGAPIVAACLLRRPDARGYTVECCRIAVTGEDPVAVTRAIATAMERWVMRDPDQWFVFQPDWIAAAS